MTNCASATWRAAGRGATVVLLLAAAALAARPAAAQSQGGAPAGFELTRSVQQSLARIQELWLQWVGASIRDDRSHADESLRGLIGTVREVGFHRLPDLALGAAAQARQSALAGEFERTRRQLEAAETLDPGRPEIAFAATAVARAPVKGKRVVMLGAGGAGRAMAVELAWAGASHLTLITRRESQGTEVAQTVTRASGVPADWVQWSSEVCVPEGTQILMNATHLGGGACARTRTD